MSYRTRQCNKIPAINVKHDLFKNIFLPSIITEWNKLDWKIKNSESIETLKKRIISFITPFPNSIFNRYNLKGIINRSILLHGGVTGSIFLGGGGGGGAKKYFLGHP